MRLNGFRHGDHCTRDYLAGLSVGSVLDVGCGDGAFTRILAESLGSFEELRGVDPDKDSVDEARQLTDDRRIGYRVLADSELQRSDERFDLVTISNALHHLSHPIASIRRLIRYLAPAGMLLVREMVSDGLAPAEENSREIHHAKAEVDRACGRVHNATYTREQIRRIVHEGSGGWQFVFSCEEHSPVERESDALPYVRDYITHLTDDTLAHELERRLDEVAVSVREVGVAQPPRLTLVCRRNE